MRPRKPNAPKKPKAPLTEEQLYESAVRSLASQARSSGQVRMMLMKKKANKTQIDNILNRLRENGYLDDARFAKYFAASRLEGGLQGKARVRRDLAARRVKPEIADQAVGAAYEEVNEAALLREYMKRKMRVTKSITKPSTLASIYRRLLRAGFSSATIIQELKRMQQHPRLAKSARNATGASLGSDVEPPSWDELIESLSEHSDTSSDSGAEIDE